MPRIIPAYRQRKGYDQAIVTLRDAATKRARDYWLGPYNTPQSRERYHRLIAQWEANRRILPAPISDHEQTPTLTIIEMICAYWKWVQDYHGAEEAASIRIVLRILKHMFGSTSAASFGPRSLRIIRQAMIAGRIEGVAIRRAWSRPFINRQIQKIIAIFKWAAGQEMIPVSVYQQLKTLEPLRRGKTTAPEPPPVLPVSDELVDPIEPFVSRQVWALIQLQRYTSARCGELFKLRPCDLNTDSQDGIWTFSPNEHKTAHRGKKRIIYFGPRAQKVIHPFLVGRHTDHYLFSPVEAESERRNTAHVCRKTPLSCGNRPGTHRVTAPSRSPGEHYSTDSYRRAIARACAEAFPPPEHLTQRKVKGKKGARWETSNEWKIRLGPRRWEELRKWRRDHHWHPHQLRHTAATQIRRQFGLEAAQIALGHSSALVTEAVYAERDMQKAAEVMRQLG